MEKYLPWVLLAIMVYGPIVVFVGVVLLGGKI